MRSSWLLVLGACALGLVTGVRGHSADVACPEAVLEATSEAIVKMTTTYNISDIGVSLGQDNGGAVGVEEAVAVIRDGGEPAQRSRALQLLRYAFAKHAVTVFRDAGAINEDVDAVRAVLGALDSEVAECDNADAVTIIPATGVEVAQLSNDKVSFSSEAGVGYSVDASAIESAATARGQLFQSECIHITFDGAEQLSAVVVDSLRAAATAAEEEAAEKKAAAEAARDANATAAGSDSAAEAANDTTTAAAVTATGSGSAVAAEDTQAAVGQQMQLRQLLSEPTAPETPVRAHQEEEAALLPADAAIEAADNAGNYDSMQSRMAELQGASSSLPLQVNAAQMTAQNMVQRAREEARTQTYTPDGSDSAHIRQWEMQQRQDMQAGARDLAEASQYGSGATDGMLSAAQAQSQMPRFRASRAQGMAVSGSSAAASAAAAAAAAGTGASQTVGLSERDPRFAEVAAAVGAGVAAPSAQYGRGAMHNHRHMHKHARVSHGSEALAAAQRLRLRMRRARSEAMAEAQEEEVAEEEEQAEEEQEAEEQEEEAEEEQMQAMSAREASVRRHRFLQRRRIQEEEAVEEQAEEQEVEQEAEQEAGMMEQSQEGMQEQGGQQEALLAQDGGVSEGMGEEAMAGGEAGMEHGEMQMQQGQEGQAEGMGEMQFRERRGQSSGARGHRNLRHHHQRHPTPSMHSHKHSHKHAHRAQPAPAKHAAVPAMQFREAAAATVSSGQQRRTGQAQQHQHAVSAAQWLANTPTVPGSAPHQIPAPQRAAMGLLARAMSSHPGSLESVGVKDVPSLAAAASNRIPSAADVRSVKGDNLLSSIMLQTASAPVSLLLCFNTPAARDQAMCPIRHAALAAHPSLLAGEDGPKSIADHVTDAVVGVANTTASLATEMTVSNATGPTSIRLDVPDSLAPCTLAAYGPVASVVVDTELNQAPPPPPAAARFASHNVESTAEQHEQQQHQAVSLSSLLRFRQVAADDQVVVADVVEEGETPADDEQDPMAEVGGEQTDSEVVTSTTPATVVPEQGVVTGDTATGTGNGYEAVSTVEEVKSVNEVITVSSAPSDANDGYKVKDKAEPVEAEELTDDEKEAEENEKRANHAILVAAKHAVQNTTAHHAAHAAAVKNSKKALADATGREPVMPLNVTTKTTHRVQVRAHPPSPSPAVSSTPSPTPTQLPKLVPVETDESIEQQRDGPAQPATLVSSVEQVDEMGLTYQEKNREAVINPIAPQTATEAAPKHVVASTKPAPSPIQASPVVAPAATIKPASE